jgi:hypothetical protein
MLSVAVQHFDFHVLVFSFKIGCELDDSIRRGQVFAHNEPFLFRRLNEKHFHTLISPSGMHCAAFPFKNCQLQGISLGGQLLNADLSVDKRV